MSEAITEARVVELLEKFGEAQATRDFDLVVPLIHPDALFRFSEGDFRGLEDVRGAFEATWTLDTGISSYRVVDVRVEATDEASAVATFGWVWSGESDHGTFDIKGRGTTVLVEHEGSLKVLIEHLSR